MEAPLPIETHSLHRHIGATMTGIDVRRPADGR